MGSLGLPATAMAVRSAFALLCFALLCGLAASSVVQSETETELKEGEVAGNQVLVEQALESRVVRGTRPRDVPEECKKLKNKKEIRKCRKAMRNRTSKQRKGDANPKACKKGKIWNKKTRSCVKRGSRSSKKDKKCKDGKTLDKTTNKCVKKASRPSENSQKAERCEMKGGQWKNGRCRETVRRAKAKSS